jgi:HlyD family secretion protein
LNISREKVEIMGKHKLKWIFAFVIAIGVGVVFIGQILPRPTLTEPVSKEIPIPVQVYRVDPHPFQEEVTGVATLRAKICSLLSSNASGNAIQIFLDMGSHVKEGQVLCQLDPTHYDLAVRQAQAALDTAQAGLEDLIAWSRPEDIAALKATAAQAKTQLKDAERNYERFQSLYNREVISKSRLETMESSYKAAHYAFQAAQENLRKAQAGPTPTALNLARSQVRQAQESLTQAEQRLQDTTIRSPIDGTVVMRNVELGQTVTPGMVLFKIVNNRVLIADVDVTEQAIGNIHVGIQSELQVDAFQGHVFSGRVIAVNSMINPRAHTFTARVEIDNPTGKLMDGMFCRVRFQTGTLSALAVPRTALLRTASTGSDYVFCIEDGKAVKKAVTIGSKQDFYVEVREGLFAGDMVVVSGTARIWQGKAVEIQNGKKYEKCGS